MTLEERMLNGKLYDCADEKLQAQQRTLNELVFDYNNTRPSDGQRRQELLRQIFQDMGEDCYIEPPLHANWAGQNVHFGKNVYANFNLTLVDDTHIYVGDGVMFGPNVTVCTGTHPVHPELRARQAQYNLPVHIGDNVWVGAGAVILPGVTIGEGSVIGAGAVVTRDIPANVVAAGVPCRVLRPITEQDRQYYGKGRAVDI